MDVYKFEKYAFERLAQSETCKLKEAFDFIVNKFPKQKLTPKKSLSKLNWLEGKSYNYAVIAEKNLTILIRHYSKHFTFWGEFVNPEVRFDNKEFFMFTFNSDFSKLSSDESDARCDNNFIDIDGSIRSFIKTIKEGHTHLVWNSSACVIPKHCEVKIAFIKRGIYSYDLLIFGCEELDSLQMQLFAENEMWNLIKKINVGDKIGRSFVKAVHTKLPEQYSDPYYHGLGIHFEGESGMKDVYCLTRYYLNDIKEYFLNGLLN